MDLSREYFVFVISYVISYVMLCYISYVMLSLMLSNFIPLEPWGQSREKAQ